MAEQRSVGESRKAGGIVSHGVERAGDVGFGRDVAVLALMQCLEAEQAGSWTGGGDGTAAMPIHGCQVVGGRVVGSFPQVPGVGGSIVVKDAAGEFQIRICDGTLGIVEREEASPRGRSEGVAPYEGGGPVERGVYRGAVV